MSVLWGHRFEFTYSIELAVTTNYVAAPSFIFFTDNVMSYNLY